MDKATLSTAAVAIIAAFSGAISAPLGPRSDPTAGHRYRRNQRERRRDVRRGGR